MRKVQNGDTVKVHYHGTLASGETFDSSEGRAPLEFKVGEGQVIAGFDNAMIDMEVGQSKKVEIPMLEAYGEAHDEMIFKFPKANFPADFTPELGMSLQMKDQQGNPVPVIIVGIEEEAIVLDANHPLAGRDLIFQIELVEIAGGKIIMP